MKFIAAAVFILCVSQAIALCTDLSGTWRNQLNSNMTIENIVGGVFIGTYHTAVESTQGAARLSSKISGVIKTVENGKLLGFNVLWNKGASLTAWVGECIVCDGKETIFTTWVLRSYQPDRKRWMSTRINQDTFLRSESEAEGANQILQSSVRDGSASSSSGIRGTWRSTSGDSFEISEVQDQGTWKGTHNGDGENGAFATGRFDGNQTYTAVGFIAASSNKIRGWTGHIDDQSTTTKILETSWLEHTFHENCNNPRKLVNFGIDNYSRS